MSIEDFNVGDVYTTKKTFTPKDFKAFSRLSGDKNPLHSDRDYAIQTAFGKPIVPMHLVASPMSAVAGMVFPGDKSLYLSHEIKSHAPVFYDEEITYSAKITNVSYLDRVLTIRTLVFKERQVLLSGTQQVQIREDTASEKYRSNKEGHTLIPSKSGATVIVGAGGVIGGSIVKRMASRGDKLILVVRSMKPEVKKLAQELETLNVDFNIKKINLVGKRVVEQLEALIKSGDHYVKNLVFAASPELTADVQTQIAVTYVALRSLTEQCLDGWLTQQKGKLVFISSSAAQFRPEGLEDYVAAKAAAESYLAGIRNRFSSFGINVHCLAPGKVDTPFSESLTQIPGRLLMPEQVAEAVVDLIEDEATKDFYHWLEYDKLRVGNHVFSDTTVRHEAPVEETSSIELRENSVSSVGDKLKALMTQFFKLEPSVDWSNAELGLVAGWDSLRHIEFILQLENTFNIKLSSDEFDLTTSYESILNFLKQRIP